MIVYCRDHAASVGVVDLAPGGFVQFHTRHPRWRNWMAAMVGTPERRTNEFTNLREITATEVRGWCRVCGERTLSIQALVSAFDQGLAKVSL